MKPYLLFKPEAANATRCQKCGAAVGEPCRGNAGWLAPHRERREALFNERRKPVVRVKP